MALTSETEPTTAIADELEDLPMILRREEPIFDGEGAQLGESPEALPELETWGLDDFDDLVCDFQGLVADAAS